MSDIEVCSSVTGSRGADWNSRLSVVKEASIFSAGSSSQG